MVIFLHGPDSFRSHERMLQLRDAFVKKYDPSGANVVSLDGAGLTIEQFRQAVLSSGFLISRRFVMLDRPLEADHAVQEAFSELLKTDAIPKETILVVRSGEEAPVKKTKAKAQASSLLNSLKALDHAETFDELRPHDVEQWIIRRVRQRGGSIDRDATAQLASAVGSDLWRAANEVDKLVHVRGGVIHAKDVETESTALETNIFDLTDALSRKEVSTAIRLLEDQLDDGANALYLVSMLARQVRILMSVADAVRQNVQPSAIADHLSLHPFVVRKALESIRTFSQSELLRAHDALVELDHTLKSTRQDPRALLDRFVLETSGG